jgi:YesN/AraC family two-component response regulator
VEEALKLNPALKIIIASGYSTSENAGDRVSGARYLTKPFDMQQLRRVLEA